jgi:zinc protease
MKKALLCSLLVFSVFVLPSHDARAMPPVQEIVSPNGIKAWLVEDHHLPLITISMAFRGGVEQDDENKQGLSSLTAALLTQGAGPYKSDAFQKRLADASIEMTFDAGRDYMTGHMKTLTRNKNEAFHLLSLALTSPRFDPEDFTRVRDQLRVAVKSKLSSPEWQGRYLLYKELYGSHPYGYRALGSERTLSSLTRDDLLSRQRTGFAQDNLKIAVVGDITALELSLELDEIFGTLPQQATLKNIKPFSWPPTTTSISIKREGTQTDVLFLGPMMQRNNPDWYAATIANYTLGGGAFSSRLMKTVRAHEGLTYGISTSLVPMDTSSLLSSSFSTDNDKAEKAVTLTKQVWQDFYEHGVTQDEVKEAQDYLSGTMALALTSRDAIAEVVLAMQTDNLGRDYLDKREGYLRSVTRADVNRVIKSWFVPSRLFASFVGQPHNLSSDKTVDMVKE